MRSNQSRQEVCPVCQEDFLHTTEAPVTVENVGESACIATFGMVFFHSAEPDELKTVECDNA